MIEEGRAGYIKIYQRSCQEARELQEWLQEQSEAVLETAELCAVALKQGNRILLCGNGGSAADAQHLATELVVRLSGDFDRPALPAMALTVDSSTLTATANDFGYDQVFARQVEAHGRPGDVLLAISTSGNSANVIEAVQTAHRRNLEVVLLLGNDGGQLREAGHCLIVPSQDTNRIQEIHITLGHLLVKIVERILYG
jgi:D-sedoheptulose 7-phosphate isomerase